MPPKKKPQPFSWNEEKKKIVIQCLTRARKLHTVQKRISIELRKQFSTEYPECKLASITLFNYAIAAEADKQLPGETCVPRWTTEKDTFLIKCVARAQEENRRSLALGLLAGKVGGQGQFGKFLLQFFLEKFPEEHTSTAIFQRVSHLRRERLLVGYESSVGESTTVSRRSMEQDGGGDIVSSASCARSLDKDGGVDKSVADFEKICRTCLAEGELKCLYENCHENVCLSEMLSSITFVQFSEKDGLPGQICLNCESELIKAYKFTQKCLQIDKKIRKVSENSVNNITKPVSPQTTNGEMKIEIDEQYEIKQEILNIECDTLETENNYYNDTFESTIKEEKNNNKDTDFEFENDNNFSESNMDDETNEENCNSNLKQPTNATNHGSQSQYSTLFPSGEETYICNICERGFSEDVTLREHMRTHTGERPAVCKLCGKSFITKADLIKHLKSHFTRISDLAAEEECQICHRKLSKLSLKAHMRSHGERNLLCNHCGRGFYKKSSLETHIRVHTGVKPYSCEVCGKSFSQPNSLKKHILTHEKPYVCKVCNRGFRCTSHLTFHMRTHGRETILV